MLKGNQSSIELSFRIFMINTKSSGIKSLKFNPDFIYNFLDIRNQLYTTAHFHLQSIFFLRALFYTYKQDGSFTSYSYKYESASLGHTRESFIINITLCGYKILRIVRFDRFESAQFRLQFILNIHQRIEILVVFIQMCACVVQNR